MTAAAIVTVLSVAVAAAAVAFAVMSAVAQRRRLAERDADCERRLAERDAACERQLADRDAACERLLKEKDAQFESFSKERDRTFGESLRTLREQFANLAEEKLKASADSLASVNRERLGDVIRPFREELDRFRKAFEENRLEQVANKASFEQAINSLGERALKIGANAESLARALKTESKTQGNWGEMVLSNILSAAGLKEGVDFLPQAQETDADGSFSSTPRRPSRRTSTTPPPPTTRLGSAQSRRTSHPSASTWTSWRTRGTSRRCAAPRATSSCSSRTRGATCSRWSTTASSRRTPSGGMSSS